MSEVQYTLSLKDLMSAPLEHANSAANKLEGTMNTLKSSIGAVGAAMGVSFAMFKGIEFVHEGVEAFEKLHQAEAQVEAGLISTGHAAGIAGEELEESAKNFAAQFKFTRADITEMQSIMLTFPGITAKTFDTASQAILDMSTRLHKGLDETAIMVGKALQDPERGITAMRRVGVNFNDTQTQIIKHLVATGHAAKAQALILQELQLEFAGSAKAAAEADPLFKFNKLMGSLKLAVGEAAISLLHWLTPALNVIGQTFKTAGEFIKEHRDIFKALAVGVGAAATVYGIYRLKLMAGTAITIINTAWTNAMALATAVYGTQTEIAAGRVGIMTVAQWAWNTALTANPIGLLIAGIAIVAAAIYAGYQKFGWFRAGLWALWAVVKEVGSLIKDFFVTVWDIVTHPFSISKLKDDFSQLADIAINAGSRIANAAKKGYTEGMADFNKDQKTSAAPHEVKKSFPIKAVEATAKPETKNAKGNKTVTINIRIDSLIKDFKISTTNIKEGTAKVQEMVTQVLMNAVNNAQIVAGS